MRVNRDGVAFAVVADAGTLRAGTAQACRP